jgi:hypothetical protein
MNRAILIILFGVGCFLPRICAAASVSATFTVNANTNSVSRSSSTGGTCAPGTAGCPKLVNTGLDVNVGDLIKVTAVGTWRISGSDPFTDANGQTGRPCHSGVTWPCSSLLGQISDRPLQVGDARAFARTFFVGKSFSKVATASGRLFLAFNDTNYGDNSGSVSATVTLTPVAGLSVGRIIAGSLGEKCLETGRCVDVYELQCTQATTRCAQARVCDNGPVDDTEFSVTIVGLDPVTLRGKGDLQFSGKGSCSTPAKVCRTTDGPLTVFVAIAEGNHQGVESYVAGFRCQNALGGDTTPTVTTRQNQ